MLSIKPSKMRDEFHNPPPPFSKIFETKKTPLPTIVDKGVLFLTANSARHLPDFWLVPGTLYSGIPAQ